MAHTPGPWTAYCASDDGDNYIGATGDRIVAQNASEDDARLIAAAPDLLAAAKLAETNLSPLYSSNHIVLMSLRAAIAKAEGK